MMTRHRGSPFPADKYIKKSAKKKRAAQILVALAIACLIMSGNSAFALPGTDTVNKEVMANAEMSVDGQATFHVVPQFGTIEATAMLLPYLEAGVAHETGRHAILEQVVQGLHDPGGTKMAAEQFDTVMRIFVGAANEGLPTEINKTDVTGTLPTALEVAVFADEIVKTSNHDVTDRIFQRYLKRQLRV